MSKQTTSDNTGDTDTIKKTFSLLGYKGGVGVSFKQVTLDLMVGSDHLVVATIGNEFSLHLFFNLSSPVRYFGNSKFGYYWKYEYGGFKLDIQESFISWESQWQDMGTTVQGFFIYAMPVLAFDPNRGSESKIRWDLGLGLGYLSAGGDVIIYPDDDPYQPFKQDVDINEPALVCYLSTEIIGSKGLLGLRVGWLQGKDSGYHYYLTEASINISYSKKF